MRQNGSTKREVEELGWRRSTARDQKGALAREVHVREWGPERVEKRRVDGGGGGGGTREYNRS